MFVSTPCTDSTSSAIAPLGPKLTRVHGKPMQPQASRSQRN